MGQKPSLSGQPGSAGDQMTEPAKQVLTYASADQAALAALLHRYGMTIQLVSPEAEIPGSFWGDEEAGLKGNCLLLRNDTPVHSMLHEACHFICMDTARRDGLDTNAGGDYDEENAVCYLQILLAGQVPGFGSNRMMQDMDAWGYSFRLGSARAWFEGDAGDAQKTLLDWGLIDASGQPSFKIRL
jgi:hypothetical protein